MAPSGFGCHALNTSSRSESIPLRVPKPREAN